MFLMRLVKNESGDIQEIMNLAPFFYLYNAPVAFQASEELKDLYEKDKGGNSADLRLGCYYRSYSQSGSTRIQYGQKAITGTSKGMRVAEAYLNRAEAQIRLYCRMVMTN